MTYLEPEGVTVEDGQKLRHDEVWLVLDDGRVRELRLRVGRGIIKDAPSGGREPGLGGSSRGACRGEGDLRSEVDPLAPAQPPSEPGAPTGQQDAGEGDESSDLLPCPFCGSDPYVTEPSFPGDNYQIGCESDVCGNEGSDGDPEGAVWRDGSTFEEVAARWNSRTPSAQPARNPLPVSSGQDKEAVAPGMDALMTVMQLALDAGVGPLQVAPLVGEVCLALRAAPQPSPLSWEEAVEKAAKWLYTRPAIKGSWSDEGEPFKNTWRADAENFLTALGFSHPSQPKP